MLRQIISIGARSVSQVKNLKITSHNVPQFQLQQCVRLFCDKLENAAPLTDKSTDAEREKRLKVLELEVEMCRQEGRRVPDHIKPSQWEEILQLDSRTARYKHYDFLFINEKKAESAKLKKKRRSEEMAEKFAQIRAEKEANEHIVYGLHNNTFFLRIYDTTIDRWHNHRLISAMQFAPKLVIDCTYDKHMTRMEARNCAKQLKFVFADNRLNEDPFDLHFCGVNYEADTMKFFEKHIPNVREPSFPLNLHEESYLEHFPRSKLVYLTPHCQNTLEKFNPDDVYIIGAMVDKKNNEPLSLAKAKGQGLRMAKLPLDHYLDWGFGGKSLTLDQMLKIMLELKNTGDWNKAFKHVPRRKLVDPHQRESEKPQSFKLEKFKDFRFNAETWGAKKFTQHSEKRLNRALENKKNTPRKLLSLQNIFAEEK